MSGWTPPELAPAGGDPVAAGWTPPELGGGSPGPGAGVRVDNPGTEAFAAGVVDSSMVGPGIYAGARLGQVGGPWGMAAGAVAGAAAGALAGPSVRSALGLRAPDEMAPDQRPLAKTQYSIGGGAAVAVTPFGAAKIGYELLERGVGKFLNAAVRRAASNPKSFAAIEAAGVVSAGLGAGAAEIAAPGDPLIALGGEVMGGLLDPVNRTINLFNGGSRVFTAAMSKYGRNAQEVKLGQEIVALMREHGSDPEMVGRVLSAANPYGLTAAQLTGDPVLVAMERALGKRSDAFARNVGDRAFEARKTMTMQINMLKADGNPEHLAAIASLRKAQFESLLGERISKAELEAVKSIGSGVRRGTTDADMPEISTKARRALDVVNEEAKAHAAKLWGQINLNVPVEMTNTQKAIDDILTRSSDELRGEKIPGFLTQAINAARKKQGTGFSYDPDTFVIGADKPSALLSDSKSMIDYRKQLLALSRAADLDPAKAPQAGYAKRLQEAVVSDIHESLGKIGDESYDTARAFSAAYHDAFERSFAGEAMAMGKRGERMDPEEMLRRAFAGGPVAADIKLQDLEKATRLMAVRGLGDEGAVELMLKAQEEAYRIITTASMKEGRINPDTMVEMVRKNGALFNRAPFNEIRDDLLKAVKSESSMRRLEDFAQRRQNDIGKDSAFARISGTSPVDYASRVLVSTADQEGQLIKMFNLARKGGKDISPEQGVSSARASILNAAFNRSMSGSTFDLDKFRGLLFTPNVAGQKSPMMIMREQGVMEPEHMRNLSMMFNTLETIKVAERQGTAIDVKQGLGEVGLILGAKILASKGASTIQHAVGQSGASIIIAGSVAKAAEAVVSKIPAAKAKDLAILLFNDPVALANVMKKEADANAQMAQIRRFHSWVIQTGVVTARDRQQLLPWTEEEPQMFSK